jgi:hypothetical protein
MGRLSGKFHHQTGKEFFNAEVKMKHRDQVLGLLQKQIGNAVHCGVPPPRCK